MIALEKRAKLTPWPEKSRPTKEVILRAFRSEGLSPYEWSNAPGYVYPEHSHTYHKVIYLLRGSIRFTLPHSGDSLDMQPGDRLDLAAGIMHGAIVGPEGVFCMEARREAG